MLLITALALLVVHPGLVESQYGETRRQLLQFQAKINSEHVSMLEQLYILCGWDSLQMGRSSLYRNQHCWDDCHDHQPK